MQIRGYANSALGARMLWRRAFGCEVLGRLVVIFFSCAEVNIENLAAGECNKVLTPYNPTFLALNVALTIGRFRLRKVYKKQNLT